MFSLPVYGILLADTLKKKMPQHLAKYLSDLRNAENLAANQSAVSEETNVDLDVEKEDKSQQRVSRGKDNGESVAETTDKERNQECEQVLYREQAFQSSVQAAASQSVISEGTNIGDLDVEKEQSAEGV